jgi:hypothetical protein
MHQPDMQSSKLRSPFTWHSVNFVLGQKHQLFGFVLGDSYIHSGCLNLNPGTPSWRTTSVISKGMDLHISKIYSLQFAIQFHWDIKWMNEWRNRNSTWHKYVDTFVWLIFHEWWKYDTVRAIDGVACVTAPIGHHIFIIVLNNASKICWSVPPSDYFKPTLVWTVFL